MPGRSLGSRVAGRGRIHGTGSVCEGIKASPGPPQQAGVDFLAEGYQLG